MSDSWHDYSGPDFPVLHYLPEFVQTHVRWEKMPSNHLILCHPLLLLPSILPNIRDFFNELALWGAPKTHASPRITIGPMDKPCSASPSTFPTQTTDTLRVATRPLCETDTASRHDLGWPQGPGWNSAGAPVDSCAHQPFHVGILVQVHGRQSSNRHPLIGNSQCFREWESGKAQGV